MSKFHKSISFQIWLPFSLAITVTILAVGFYYPKKQEEVYIMQIQAKLKEIAKTAALGVEISLKNDDFHGLEQVIDLASSTVDFEYIAIIEKSSNDGDKVFVSNPKEYDSEKILNTDLANYIYVEHPINNNLNGIVRMATTKESIRNAIFKVNAPVYKFLGTIFLGSILLFYFIAYFISRPLKILTNVANELELENYEITLIPIEGNSELVDLNNALCSLRDNLKVAKDRNELLNKFLEGEIVQRTLDLEFTTKKLENAQRIARLGHFDYFIDNDSWEFSKSVSNLLEINHNDQQSIVKLLKSPYNAEFVSIIQECIKNKTHITRDIKIKIIKDNISSEMWLAIQVHPIVNPNDTVIIISGTIQDITKRKFIEEQLYKVSLVAERTSNLVIITDKFRKITWVNKSVLDLTGYEESEIIGQTPKIFQSERTDKNKVREINEKLGRLQSIRDELINKTKDGNDYWIDLSIVPLFDFNKEHIGYIAVESDITERKKFENEIKESEENYRIILENSSEMIHTLDNSGNIVWANRSWKEKMGVNHIDIEGENLIKFLDSKTNEEFQRVMPELYTGKTITDLDCTFISTNGDNLKLIGRTIPLFKNGEIVGSQAYLHDITKIRNAEEELRNLLHLTQKQNERLKNFAHIVSHNIRSHSANLAGLVRELSDVESEEERTMFTNLLKAGTEKLNETIYNLNEIVTINENSNISLTSKSILSEIDKTLNVVANSLIKNNIEIIKEVNPDLEVMVVSSYLESIVLNLITNAIKYRDANKQSFVKINAERTGHLIKLSVADNGLGIDLNKYGTKLFGMYKTFHKHADARGVGLFITKAQIEAMGGKIEVKSEPGNGTTFYVHLISAN
jgi:PAS domain S-box-containing protein